MKTFVSVLFFFVMVGGALQSCIGEKERVESSASIGWAIVCLSLILGCLMVVCFNHALIDTP